MARPRSDISTRIVHAARACFLRDGVDGTSQRRVAREARTNLGMLYYYFPTKDDLFLAVVEEIYSKLLGDLTEAARPNVSVEEQLRAIYERLGRLSADEADVLRIAIREMLVSTARRGRLFERFSHGHLPLLVRLLAQGQDAGELRSVGAPIADVMAVLALAVAPQIAARVLTPLLERHLTVPPGVELAAMCHSTLLDGIRSRNRTAKP